MKCPLQGFEGSKWGGIEKVEAVDCLKGKCAWWDEDKVCCFLRTLTKQVTRLAGRKEVDQ